jgi:predicted nucleic acid-binding protein
MPSVRIFVDSSALFSGIVSSAGAARVLLMLGEMKQIRLIVSEQVIAETERAVARKAPQAVADLRRAILASNVEIVPIPTEREVRKHAGLINHPADVPILVAAMREKVDYLVTLNTLHFIEDPEVARKSDLRIGTPGDTLAWLRDRYRKEL